MKVTTIKTFPPVATSADNPYGFTPSFAATISGKIVTVASGLNNKLLEPSGDSHRQPALMFDFLHIQTGSTNQIREIDHIINDTTLKLKNSVLDVSASCYALKRLKYTEAKLISVGGAANDPIVFAVLNDDNTSSAIVTAPISIPKDRNHECVPFLVNGTSKSVEVTTNPSEYPA